MGFIVAAIVVFLAILLMADRGAAAMDWFIRRFYRISGTPNPWGKAGGRSFYRWALRLWAVCALAILAWALVANIKD
jgi:hypothetical protein